MKKSTLTLALAALAIGLAGCGTPSGYQQADMTGESINKLRNIVTGIKTSVDDCQKAMDGLAAAASTDPRPAYETFAKSVDKVNAAAENAKKQAEDMRTRGQAYFQQWEKELAAVQSEDIRKRALERKAKLQETFDSIKEVAQAAKTSFEPYSSDLKDLKTALGLDLTVQGIDAVKKQFKKTKAEGMEVQKNLDALIAELNTVVAAITANKPPPPPAK
jgi:uncharacterized protein YoxC